MTAKKTNPLTLYLWTLLIGTVIITFLLIFVCTIFHFDRKSAICVYLYGIPGYCIKTVIFTLSYFLLYRQSIMDNKAKRTLVIWTPFILFFFWFLLIIVFQIESLYTDLSFGYISRFPHFYAQLLTTLVPCTVTAIRINRRHRIGRTLAAP